MEQIKPITNLIQLQKTLQPSIPKLMPFSNEKPSERLASARNITKLILGRYPDFNKSTADYISGMVAVIATFPICVQERLADMRTGVSSVCEYLPTQAHIIKLGDALEAQERALHETKPMVKVFEGTAAWDAWQKTRPMGTPCIEMQNEAGEKVRGWYFPTEYPLEEAAKRIGAL